MEQMEELEMQLWEYIDGTCSGADSQRIAVLIASDEEWRHKYNELYAIHSAIATSAELEHPPMRFTKNVMESVAATHIAPATKKYINKSIIRGIAAFFIITIASLLGYALANTNWSGGAGTFTIPKFNLGNLFNSSFFNIAIAINIVLALVLADKILRKKQRSAH